MTEEQKRKVEAVRDLIGKPTIYLDGVTWIPNAKSVPRQKVVIRDGCIVQVLEEVKL